jgi:hypothetical protein
MDLHKGMLRSMHHTDMNMHGGLHNLVGGTTLEVDAQYQRFIVWLLTQVHWAWHARHAHS